MTRRVGQYELLRIIGRGGMATVYLARQTDLDRDVALKELKVLAESDPRLARRFLHEARLAGSFSHPNIVTVHDYLEYEGTPYIAMEYLPRGSLRPYAGRMSLAQIGGMLLGVLAGLAHAEERGVVHRDLKPENIMVTEQGSVKIADFGIAKATSFAQTEANLTTTGTTLGTPRYMAPERAMGQEVGPWTDLYSVGVIVFELLVGKPPFHDTDAPMAILMRQINDEIPRIGSLVPDVDPAISDWTARLLEKDPAQRTESAAVAGRELDEILMELLGSRWLREAGLPATPGGPASPLAGTPGRAVRAVATSSTVPMDDEPAAAATVPQEAGDRHAATVAPVTLRAESEPAPRPRRRGRLPGLARLALLIGGLSVGIAAAVSAGGGDPPSPRESAPARANAFDALQRQVRAHTGTLAAASTPDAQRRAALALARDYGATARALGESGTPDRQLVAALERTGRAYREVAAAANPGHDATYRAALSIARDREAAVDDALQTAAHEPRAPEPRSTPDGSGVGDSRSDDPSDDEPDEDDNGD